MNEDIKGLVFALHREISKLHLILEQCRQLYSNPETVSILNKTAGVFFQVVQSQFFDALLLGISRLTDKRITSSKRNLTINAISELLHDEKLKAEVESLCGNAELASQFARSHRNKRISHLDEVYYVNQESSPLNKATFAMIEESLKAIEAVISLVFSKCLNTVVEYKFINLQGSADVLVSRLKLLGAANEKR
jgi:hypothetical protein